MEKIEFTRTPYKKRRTLIEAYYGTQNIGRLDYLPPLRDGLPVEIGLLSVHDEYQRTGVATALLKEFRTDIGSGVNVVSTVTHEPTWDFLKLYNPDLNASNKIVLTITDSLLLEHIPIARVLKAGGIQAIRFRVVYSPREARLQSGSNIRGITFR